jgi:two-component system phosphate regulon response regulator PhoB
MPDTTILGVDSDPESLQALRKAVFASGHDFVAARGGEEALQLARKTNPDAVVVRTGFPDMSGRELVSRLRTETAGTPILLSARKGEEPEAAAGLEQGATSLVFSPIEERDLAQRLGALLRWSKSPRRDGLLEAGPVTVDLERGELVKPLRQPLTALELEILRLLLAPPGRCVTRRQIPAGNERAVDVHVAALRAKLGAAGRRIETVRGVGYRFRP